MTELEERLLAACEFALRELNDMTVPEFERGADRILREALAEAIAAAKKEWS